MRTLRSRNKNWLLIQFVGINTVCVWIKFNITPSYQENKIYTSAEKIITQEHTKLVGKENPSTEGKISGIFLFFYFIFIITRWDPLVSYKSCSRCVSLLVLG